MKERGLKIMHKIILWMKENTKRKQKIICSLMLFTILFFNLNPVHALTINSSAAALMELKSGEILYEKNSEVQRAMGSTAKIMTYLLTMEAVSQGKIKVSDRVKISKNAANSGGSSYNLKQNDLVTVDELLASMLIISGCDSAVALAEYVGGSVEKFAVQMNKKAKEIGLTSAYFLNPHGLPLGNGNQNKISAKDLALLTKYTLDKYEDHLIGITSQKYFYGTYRSYTGKNTNKLLEITSYADGIKTGTTNLAGYCLVSTAKNKDTGNRFVSVVLGGKSPNDRYADSKKILEYGLNSYKEPITVFIGEEPIIFEGVKPMIKDDTTLLPLRIVTQSLGGFIEWDESNKMISGGKDDYSYQLTLNSKGAIVNGQAKELLTPPIIIQGSTMVPIRFIAESLGMKVKWNGDTRAIKITSNN